MSGDGNEGPTASATHKKGGPEALRLGGVQPPQRTEAAAEVERPSFWIAVGQWWLEQLDERLPGLNCPQISKKPLPLDLLHGCGQLVI